MILQRREALVRQMGYRVFEETFRGSLGSRERKEQEYPIPPLEIGQTVGRS